MHVVGRLRNSLTSATQNALIKPHKYMQKPKISLPSYLIHQILSLFFGLLFYDLVLKDLMVEVIKTSNHYLLRLGNNAPTITPSKLSDFRKLSRRFLSA